jgi:amidase
MSDARPEAEGDLSSATEIARRIRAREHSCEETVAACLRRIEEVNPRLNAVVQLCAERALGEARRADRAFARGEAVGPLHGLPITIKDNLDTAGVISAGGTQGRARFVPEGDATAVARLRAAGAILLGKTNTPELTMAYETDNLVYGRTNHPLDVSLTCGGSSGGAAAILAMGGSALDIGSDTGGSIRVPAHFCGIAGLKPTAGRVPKTGHILPFGGVIDAMTQLGPMARRVEDLALVLPIIAGMDWRDPSAVPMPLRGVDQATALLSGLRVAFYVSNGILEPAPEVAAAVRRAAALLADAGARVQEARPPGIEESCDLTLALWSADGGAVFERVLQRAGTHELHPFMQGVLDICRAGAKAGREFCATLERWGRFCGEMLRFMENYDVLLSPVAPFAALPHGATFAANRFPGFSYTMLHNLTGWPALALPFGATPQGLPIGVQLAAAPWREDLILGAARCLERKAGRKATR